MNNDKGYLLENQLLFQIEKQKKRLIEINKLKKSGDISVMDYDAAFYSCNGAIDQMMICLSCYDNPANNFSAIANKNKL